MQMKLWQEVSMSNPQYCNINHSLLGLVSKVFPVDQSVTEALKTARKIASYSTPVVSMAKEAINTGTTTHLHSNDNFVSFQLNIK